MSWGGTSTDASSGDVMNTSNLSRALSDLAAHPAGSPSTQSQANGALLGK